MERVSKMNLVVIAVFLILASTKLSLSAVYHLISGDRKPSQNPMRTVRTKFQRQCISVCATWNACKSYSIQPGVNKKDSFECFFYEKIFDEDDLIKTQDSRYFVDPQTCQDWYKIGGRVSGVYSINWMGREMKEVRCNMELEGGGWLVLLRRTNQFIQNFTREWNDYKEGFGDVRNEFWLGNDYLHEVTSCKKHLVLVYGQKKNGDKAISVYGSFAVANEENLYRMTYNKTLLKGIESFEFYNQNQDKSLYNVSFSSPDRDNDRVENTNCAAEKGGGFWYSTCGNLHLLRPMRIRWYTFNGDGGLQEAQIMIKEM